MKSLRIILGTEFGKLKRTLAFAMVFIAPVLVILLQIMLWMNMKKGFSDDRDLWNSFSINILSMWAIFMYPLVCALVVGLVYHYEHANQGWMKLYSYPVPKWTIMASKQIVVVVLLSISMLVLFSGMILGGWVVDGLHPNIRMPAEIPFGKMIGRTGVVFLSSLLIVAIQNWLSFRWSSITVPLGSGISGVFLAVFASGWKYGHFFPWLMPIHVLHSGGDKYFFSLVLGSIGGMLLFMAALIDSTRRDVKF